MNGEQLEALDDRYLASAMKVRFSRLTVAHADGCRVTDTDGITRLDFSAGWGVANLGHNNARVQRAAVQQLPLSTFGCLASVMNEPAACLAERLVGLMPGDFEKRVWYGLHGSDANDCLAKLLPVATGRPRLISFIGGYHGQTGGSAGLSGHSAQALAAGMPNVTKIPYPDHYRPVFGDGNREAVAVLDHLRDYIFPTVCPPERTAAIFVEALQSDAGDLVPDPEFLRGLQALCRRHGIMLVLDEVKTGFGRTGRQFCFEHAGVTPDAVSLGKPLGAGVPISAVVARRELLDIGVATNMYTQAGNPTACAAALAQIEETERLGLSERSARSGRTLVAALRELQRRHPLIGDVRGLGLMVGLDLVGDRDTKRPAPRAAAKVVFRAFELGLVVFYGGIHANVLELTPPLIATDEELAEGVEILDRAFADVEAGRVSDGQLGRYGGW